MTADVVVVGAGVAGLSAALGVAATRHVIVLEAGDGSTPWAQGGIAAAFGEDTPAAHADDTLVAGAHAGDVDAVRVLVEEGPGRVAELISAGAIFDRDASGALAHTYEGGHRYPRVIHAGGDATGAEVARALRAAAVSAGVEIRPAHVTGLIRSSAGGPPASEGVAGGGGQVTGVITDAGPLAARAVVLATGGIGNAYLASTNPAAVRGDGIALALRAGASLVDMEFVQFHPTALFTGATEGQLPLVTEAVRGAGAVLRDDAGVAFMADKHPLADLAPRDVVAREIDAVMTRDSVDHVWLDATSIDADTFARRFPTVLASCAAIGVDPARDLIPVAPAEHFLCGGVRVDARGATDVAGLYAVGEVAATGVHGANRLASNSLLEGLVFGRRLAASLTLSLAPQTEGDEVIELGVDDDPDKVRGVLSRYAGIRRDGAGLTIAAAQLDGLGDGPLATVARAVVVAATARAESRGCHFRTDHPAAITTGREPVIIRLGTDGRPVSDILWNEQ